MGVFPLADTMNCFSNPPLSRGGTSRAPASGRTDEVWWYPYPTTHPRRMAAAAHSPIHYIARSHALTRCTDTRPRFASAARDIRRHPTVRIPDWTDGSAAERGPPVRHLPHAGTPHPPACMRHSSPVAAPQSTVFAAGGTRMQ
jgi:hypothetical protein